MNRSLMVLGVAAAERGENELRHNIALILSKPKGRLSRACPASASVAARGKRVCG